MYTHLGSIASTKAANHDAHNISQVIQLRPQLLPTGGTVAGVTVLGHAVPGVDIIAVAAVSSHVCSALNLRAAVKRALRLRTRTHLSSLHPDSRGSSKLARYSGVVHTHRLAGQGGPVWPLQSAIGGASRPRLRPLAVLFTPCLTVCLVARARAAACGATRQVSLFKDAVPTAGLCCRPPFRAPPARASAPGGEMTIRLRDRYSARRRSLHGQR